MHLSLKFQNPGKQPYFNAPTKTNVHLFLNIR